MDTIRLTGVQGMGTHGVLDYEHQRAQPFIVDAVLHLDQFCRPYSVRSAIARW